MLDPVVHAALVVVFAWLVQLLFSFLGLDFGNDVAAGLAQVIVAYILSIFGYGLWFKTKIAVFKSTPSYRPPFS